MQTELFMYFCIKKYIGTQGVVCRQLKIFLPPPPRWFMLLTVLRRWSRCCSCSVWLCSLCCGVLRVLGYSRALCPRVSSFLLALWSPRFGRGCWSVCFSCVCLFVFFCTCCFCHFSLPLGIGGWLRFVAVALPGLFY